jgi:hypothetical protein
MRTLREKWVSWRRRRICRNDKDHHGPHRIIIAYIISTPTQFSLLLLPTSLYVCQTCTLSITCLLNAMKICLHIYRVY